MQLFNSNASFASSKLSYENNPNDSKKVRRRSPFPIRKCCNLFRLESESLRNRYLGSRAIEGLRQFFRLLILFLQHFDESESAKTLIHLLELNLIGSAEGVSIRNIFKCAKNIHKVALHGVECVYDNRVCYIFARCIHSSSRPLDLSSSFTRSALVLKMLWV